MIERDFISKHLVDPDLLGGLDLIPDLNIKSDADVVRLRAMFTPPDFPPEVFRAERVDYSEKTFTSDPGAPDVRVLVYSPKRRSEPTPVLLWFHGGGYVFAGPELNSPLCCEIADIVNCCVISVDYRVAPETPWPGALEDASIALNWIYANAESLNIDPSRIAVGGDSAGGGLAAALAQFTRDTKGPAICFQLLNAPMLDDRTAVKANVDSLVGEFVWQPDTNRYCWGAYLGATPGSQDISAHAAPARATDFSNLPPAFISVGALDLFLDENITYTRNLIRAGVPTQLAIVPGAYHGFEIVAHAPIVRDILSTRLTALKKAFAIR